MWIDVEQIKWDGLVAYLVKGETSERDAEDAVRALFVSNPEYPLEVGPVERFRRWPGQWHEHIDRNKSESIIGTFKARLVR